jgi:hypothetical protein
LSSTPRDVIWGEIGIITKNAAANSVPIIEVFMIEFPFVFAFTARHATNRFITCREPVHYPVSLMAGWPPQSLT